MQVTYPLDADHAPGSTRELAAKLAMICATLMAVERLVAEAPETRDTVASDSPRLELLKSAFGLLSDVEQTVLRGTMFWWRPDQLYQRMPHAALSQLSEQTGKSAANIRQIRLRAIKKLQEYVNDRFRP